MSSKAIAGVKNIIRIALDPIKKRRRRRRKAQGMRTAEKRIPAQQQQLPLGSFLQLGSQLRDFQTSQNQILKSSEQRLASLQQQLRNEQAQRQQLQGLTQTTAQLALKTEEQQAKKPSITSFFSAKKERPAEAQELREQLYRLPPENPAFSSQAQGAGGMGSLRATPDKMRFIRETYEREVRALQKAKDLEGLKNFSKDLGVDQRAARYLDPLVNRMLQSGAPQFDTFVSRMLATIPESPPLGTRRGALFGGEEKKEEAGFSIAFN